MAVSANRLELLQIADAVAREKSIDRGIVIAAMEDAIQKAARSRYGSETEVRAEINPKTGEMRLSRLLLVLLERTRRGLKPGNHRGLPGLDGGAEGIRIAMHLATPLGNPLYSGTR